MALNSFKVKIGEREITGKVQEKSQAKQTYTTAVSSNKRASLLEKHEDTYLIYLYCRQVLINFR